MTNMVAALRDFTQDTKGTLEQLACAQQEPAEHPSRHLYETSEDDDAVPTTGHTVTEIQNFHHSPEKSHGKPGSTGSLM